MTAHLGYPKESVFYLYTFTFVVLNCLIVLFGVWNASDPKGKFSFMMNDKTLLLFVKTGHSAKDRTHKVCPELGDVLCMHGCGHFFYIFITSGNDRQPKVKDLLVTERL